MRSDFKDSPAIEINTLPDPHFASIKEQSRYNSDSGPKLNFNPRSSGTPLTSRHPTS